MRCEDWGGGERGGTYAPRGCQGAVDVEEADCVGNGALGERGVEGCCFGHFEGLW